MNVKAVVLSFLVIPLLLIGGLRASTLADPSIPIRSEGWSVISREDGIIVEAQSIPGHQFKAYRAKGVLAAPIDQILGVLGDNACATQWIPDISYQQVISELSAIEIITYSVYAVPFPFADRELLLHSQLRLDRNRGALMAEAASIDHPGVPVTRGNVRAHMRFSQTWLRPLADGRTEVEFVLMIEPRGKIPAFLAAFGLRQTPFKFLKALESRARVSTYSLRPSHQKLLQQLAETGD